MHELGIMTGVIDAVEESARQAGADKVLKISLSVGVMSEAIEDALQFAFEALSEGTLSQGATLEIMLIEPRSQCQECGATYTHDRYTIGCPTCKSFATKLIAGKELHIDSIEVDIPDEDESTKEASQEKK